MLQEDRTGALSIPRISEVLDSQELGVIIGEFIHSTNITPYMGQMRNIYKCLLFQSWCLDIFFHSTMRNSWSQSFFSSGNGTASASFVWVVATSSKVI